MAADPLVWPIDTVTDTKVSVGSSTTVVLAANEARVNAVIVNDSDEIVYIGRGNAAVLNEGIRLNASGGSYEIDSTNLFRGAINGISTSGTKNVTVSEGV